MGGQMIHTGDLADAHCMLPVEYDLFVDYKAVRTHVWAENHYRRRDQNVNIESWANASDVEYAINQLLDTHAVLGRRGVKILHWPGELRKPWQRWHAAVRSAWDEKWWEAHAAMCRESS